MERITVQIATRDRHSELALMLQSLRTQTIQDFDIMILDESSTPMPQCYFLNYILNRLKFEGHRIKLIRNTVSKGVCFARQKLIDEDTYNNPLTIRLDDDILLQQNYLEKLMEVINKGYDMASGVIPLLSTPEIEREVRFVKPIICYHQLDNEGNIIERRDDLGFCYLTEEILPCMQFRTNCLMKNEILEKVKYPLTLTQTGFREELWISFQAIIKGYSIGCNTSAKSYHLQCPSGGVRFNPQQYAQNIALDEETTNKWVKEMFSKHGDFLQNYYDKVVK